MKKLLLPLFVLITGLSFGQIITEGDFNTTTTGVMTKTNALPWIAQNYYAQNTCGDLTVGEDEDVRVFETATGEREIHMYDLGTKCTGTPNTAKEQTALLQQNMLNLTPNTTYNVTVDVSASTGATVGNNNNAFQFQIRTVIGGNNSKVQWFENSTLDQVNIAASSIPVLPNTTGITQTTTFTTPATIPTSTYYLTLMKPKGVIGDAYYLIVDNITVTDATPSCSAADDVTGLSASNGNTEVDLSWTNGACFDEILVVAKSGSAVTVTPTGDGTGYAANAAFGSGTDLGTGEFAVYKGTGTVETITGLTNDTAYHFEVFARYGTDWSAGVVANATPSAICSGLGLSPTTSGLRWRLDSDCTNDFVGTETGVPNSGVYNLTMDTGTATGYIQISFLVEEDGSNIGFDQTTLESIFANDQADILEITTNPNNDFSIEWIEHNWNKTNCSWNWNRRIDVSIKYNGTDWGNVQNLALAFNRNDLLESTNGGTYCSQLVNIAYTPSNCTTPDDVIGLSATPGNTQVDLSWTNGACYDEILVVAKEGSAVTVTPTGDGTTYTANAAFGSGTDLGTGEFAVYKGTGASETITSLTNGTAYHFEVFARLGTTWSSGVITDATPAVPTSPILMITEYMAQPTGTDKGREYFEVYNSGTVAVDIHGWSFERNGNNTHTFDTSSTGTNSTLIIQPSEFAVIGNMLSAGFTNLDGVTIDYYYLNSGSNFVFVANDYIILRDGSNNVIDTVQWGSTNPNPDNLPSAVAAKANIFTGIDADDNNIGSNWTLATGTYDGGTNLGSPGSGEEQSVSNLTYLNSGSWYPSAPDGSTGTKDVYIRGTLTLGTSTVDEIFVEATGNLTVSSGQTITANELTLTSSSTQYPSLILDGTLSGTTVNYERFTAQESVTGGSNDLIAAPVTGQTFGAFSTANSNLSFNAGTPTQKLFGPFDNAANPGAYLTWDSTTNSAETFDPGVGYRTATTGVGGGNLTFSGTVNSGPLAVSITDEIGSYGSWNLIGNPFPSYLSLKTFLDLATDDANAGADNKLDPSYSAIYGYDATGSVWTIWDKNNTNYATDVITPGQGFFVKAKAGAGTVLDDTQVSFTSLMRTYGITDDFISGRITDANFALVKLNLTNTDNTYSSNIYFRDINTRGLDPGYDTGAYGGNANGIFTHLVEDNAGVEMANQSLPYLDIDNVVVPLGIKANQGVQISIGLDVASTFPAANFVYLEDNVTNSWTLLNTGDYTFTPSSVISGTGRFFVHFSATTLSTDDYSLSGLQIYSQLTTKIIVVKGQLMNNSTISIYDVQGRIVISKSLDNNSNTNTIDVSNFNTGIYIVQIKNNTLSKTQKVIIR